MLQYTVPRVVITSIFQDICPIQVFSSSNSYIFLDISVGPLFPVNVGTAGSLIDRSESPTYLVRGTRSTHFLWFTTTYCNIIFFNFWKLSMKF